MILHLLRFLALFVANAGSRKFSKNKSKVYDVSLHQYSDLAKNLAVQLRIGQFG